jgi:hypothetical protein
MSEKMFSLAIAGITALLALWFRISSSEPSDPYDD